MKVVMMWYNIQHTTYNWCFHKIYSMVGNYVIIIYMPLVSICLYTVSRTKNVRIIIYILNIIRPFIISRTAVLCRHILKPNIYPLYWFVTYEVTARSTWETWDKRACTLKCLAAIIWNMRLGTWKILLTWNEE